MKIDRNSSLTPKQRRQRAIAYVLFVIQALGYIGDIINFIREGYNGYSGILSSLMQGNLIGFAISFATFNIPIIVGLILFSNSKNRTKE